MNPLDFLDKLTLVLLIGVFVGLVAKKLKLPSMFLLITTGAIISRITVNGKDFFNFTDTFLISASIITLVMLVFKNSADFSWHQLDEYTESAIKLAIVFLVLNMLFLSVATHLMFGIQSILMSLIFAAVMSGTDPGTVLSLFHDKSNRVVDILKFESVANTPLTVLIPFILLDLMEFDQSTINNFLQYFYPFIQQIIAGIGTGVFFGIIVFRFMKKFYSEQISPLTLVTSAMLTYIVAEKIGGNGVLAVTVLGVLFGNISVKKKPELQEFSGMLSNVLEIFVFILIGFLIPTDIEIGFFVKSLVLFFIMVIIRFAAMEIVFIGDHINIKERIFMALNCSKGIAVAVVAFTFSTYAFSTDIVCAGTILDLMILFLLYSVILSSIVAKFSQNFIRLKIEA